MASSGSASRRTPPRRAASNTEINRRPLPDQSPTVWLMDAVATCAVRGVVIVPPGHFVCRAGVHEQGCPSRTRHMSAMVGMFVRWTLRMARGEAQVAALVPAPPKDIQAAADVEA